MGMWALFGWMARPQEKPKEEKAEKKEGEDVVMKGA